MESADHVHIVTFDMSGKFLQQYPKAVERYSSHLPAVATKWDSAGAVEVPGPGGYCAASPGTACT